MDSTSILVLRALRDGRATVAAIARVSHHADNEVRKAAYRLRKIGYLENVDRGLYRITPEGQRWLRRAERGQLPTHLNRRAKTPNGLRERAWWYMRQTRRWTMRALLTTLHDGTEATAENTLGGYLRALEAAGIVRRAKRKITGPGIGTSGLTLWLLVKDLGRHAPAPSRTRGDLYDPNSGTVLRLESGDHPAVPSAPALPAVQPAPQPEESHHA